MHQASEQSIPTQCTVLIIGGGPAGSSAATFLAQSGIDVVLLEKQAFPRNQVGESLIPHFWKFADLLGVTEKIKAEQFVIKSGGIFAWQDKVRQVKFAEFGYDRPGLHVERDRFDHILLEHAQSIGVSVITEVIVKRVDFSNSELPTVFYTDKRGDTNRESKIRCRYIIDASGHSSFLASQLGTRQTISSELKFLSLWGYYRNSRYLGVDRACHTPDQIQQQLPVTFVMSFSDGWIWHIILRESTSVGLVVHNDKTRGMDKAQRELFFKQTCAEVPYLRELLRDAEFIEDSLQFRPDYSYYSTQICGENYYCIGDAAAFVDPIFSHGVQNAFYNASISTIAIKESLKNPRQRARYSQLCESRMQQFYGFSRALSLGDYGINGVNRELVKPLMKTLPPLELELIYLISQVTNRSENFIQLAQETGVWNSFAEQHIERLTENIHLDFS